MGRKQDITHGAERKRIEKHKGKQEQKFNRKKKRTRIIIGRVAQSVERAVDNGKVVGSKPISPRLKKQMEGE